MKTKRKTERKIDQVAKKNYAKIGSKFSLVNKGEIKKLQFLIVTAFALGMIGAVVWGFKSDLYSGSEAARSVATTPDWIAAVGCSGFSVYKQDLATLEKWKVDDSDCTAPQCVNLSLVNPATNPNVDFSQYPAQNACKAIGGRLPSESEIQCIYKKRTSYGQPFVDNPTDGNAFYWTSISGGAPYNLKNAVNMFFGSRGFTSVAPRSIPYHVRCVK